jgi:hypothetical protein
MHFDRRTQSLVAGSRESPVDQHAIDLCKRYALQSLSANDTTADADDEVIAAEVGNRYDET